METDEDATQDDSAEAKRRDDHLSLAVERGLSFAIKLWSGNWDRWAVKDYKLRDEPSGLWILDAYTETVVKMYPTGRWFDMELHLRKGMISRDWERWLPKESPNSPYWRGE